MNERELTGQSERSQATEPDFRALSQELQEANRLLREANQESSRLKAELENRVEARTLELTQTNEALRATEERFRGLMEQAPFSVQIFAPDGRILRVNRAWEELWGTTLDQMDAYNVLHDPQLEQKGIAAYIRRAFAGEPVRIPAIQYDPNETLPGLTHHLAPRRWLAAVAYPLKDTAGRVREVVLVHEDITARRRAEEQLHFLSEASSVLSASLDYDETLKRVAQLAVPTLADWCAVDVLLEDRSIRRVAVVHPDPAKVALAYELLHRYPLHIDLPEGTVMRRGQAMLHREITDCQLSAVARDAEHLAILRALNLKSTMVVPMSARGRILGAISFVSDQSSRRYGPEDLALAEELARRAALAVDNARLYGTAQEILEEKDELLALLDTWQQNAPAGFAFVDRQFRYLRINDALAAMDGKSAADLLGKTVQEAVPELWPHVEPLYRGVLESGHPVLNRVITGKTPAAPDQTCHWLVNYFPVRVRGDIVGVGILVVDITERRRLEDELRQRAQRLAEADRLKDEFLATLAHELRNPLAPIRNSLHILKHPGVNSVMLQQVRDMAERQVQHMARLLDDLLDVSRISRGKIELRKEVLDVAAVVDRAVEAVRSLLAERRHELTLSLAAEPLRVEADATRLEQVLANLLNNAAKYTDPGGHIWLTVERRDNQAVLRVRDTGIGIALDMLSKVFDLFVQVNHAASRSHGGLGIGLTLVRNLVAMHHGTVEAHSAGSGKGSEFVVRLPLADRKREGPSEREKGLQLPQTLPSSGHRLLVVDDNQDAADSLVLLLRLQGHEVRVAYNGLTALELLNGYRPELVFLDLGMPDMDGYEVARCLRQRPGLEKLPLAALTGWGQHHDRHRTAEAGFDYHLVKPIEPKVLEELLAGLK